MHVQQVFLGRVLNIALRLLLETIAIQVAQSHCSELPLHPRLLLVLGSCRIVLRLRVASKLDMIEIRTYTEN